MGFCLSKNKVICEQKESNMLKAEVVIGNDYMTDVSGNDVRVRVLYEVTDRYSKRTKYMVRRVDNGKNLDKPRGPGVLYPCNNEPFRY